MPSLVLWFILSLSVASGATKLEKGVPENEGKIASASRKSVVETVDDTTATAAKVAQTDGDAKIAAVSAQSATEEPPAVAKLREIIVGLEMQSETDAPFKVFYWPTEKDVISPAEVASFFSTKTDVAIEIKAVGAYFQRYTVIEDWMGDEEKAMTVRFQKLIVAFETQLENPQVYLIGEREKTVAVVGKVKGGFGGVVTLVVET